MAALPPAAAPLLNESTFPKRGPCKSVPQMVHGLTFNGLLPVDTWGVSCTNGWTGGNWAGRASDAAKVAHALWGGGGGALVSPALSDAMKTFVPLDRGPWGIGLPYGLGAMDIGSQMGLFKRPAGVYIGHGGETFGFTGFAGFVPSKNVSLAIFANAENGAATLEATAAALSLLGV